MNILISEDNDHKYKKIFNYIKRIHPTCSIIRTETAKSTIIELMKYQYDFLIQDMMLPINNDERIDREGGLFVIERAKYKYINVKTIICSSEDMSELLKSKNIDTPSVVFVYNSTSWHNSIKLFLSNQLL